LKFKKLKKGFTNYFGSKVDVKVAEMEKEKLQFHFNQEDFNRIMELIKG
jgi:ParB family chromosome partitioning protein